MGKTLAFVETGAQVQDGISLARKTSRALTWIALAPRASWELERLGEPFHDLDEFADLPALAELDTLSIERTESFCRFIDERLAAFAPGLQSGLSCYYNLRHVFNAPALCDAYYRRIRAAFPEAGEIWFWESPAEAPGPELRLKRESMWSRYLALRLKRDNIPFKAFPAVGDEPALARPRPRAWFKAFQCLVETVRALFYPPARRLAVLDESYSLGLMLERNRARGDFTVFNLSRLLQILAPLLRLRPGRGRAAREASLLWSSLCREPEFKRRFVWDGLDVFPLVEGQLSYFFRDLVPEMMGLDGLAFRMLALMRPKAVLASAMGLFREKIIALAARRARVPFVVYQHGEIGLRTMGPRSPNFWYYNDVYFSDLFLVFGRGQEAFCREKYGDRAKTACVGSAALDRLTERARKADRKRVKESLGFSPDRPLVAYPLGQFGMGIKVPPTYRTDCAAVKLERRVVDLFAEFPGADLVVIPKLGEFWAQNPLPEYLASRKYPNVFLHTTGFGKLLQAADAFIMDWPSTAFLEALTTDRPILITDCGLNWQWQESARAHFGKRVLYARELEDFLALVRKTLKERDFGPRPDRGFISEYGTFLDDGRSAERALERLAAL
ncbi:MAG: hypothetical protein HY921_13080 [Elusimicrobia bacterium]|nr:hypothetical protein [Elusimicrobiota bacterium]